MSLSADVVTQRTGPGFNINKQTGDISQISWAGDRVAINFLQKDHVVHHTPLLNYHHFNSLPMKFKKKVKTSFNFVIIGTNYLCHCSMYSLNVKRLDLCLSVYSILWISYTRCILSMTVNETGHKNNNSEVLNASNHFLKIYSKSVTN